MDQLMHMRGLNSSALDARRMSTRPSRAEWRGRGPAHSEARIQYKLTPDGDGATEFEYTNEFHAPGGRLGNGATA